MAKKEIQLYADHLGIWCQDGKGPRFGIKWDEIISIGGYTITYFDDPEIEIEFDFHYGESFRINQTWSGFDHVVSSVTEHGMFEEEDWLAKVAAVGDDDEIYEIWKKP